MTEATLVFYMGLNSLDWICRSLISAGMSPAMPAAAIQQGTTPNQRRIISQLSLLASDVEQQQLQAPVMIVIGEVVSLAYELDWFSSAPLEEFNESITA